LPVVAQETGEPQRFYDENPPLSAPQAEALDDSLLADILALSDRVKLNEDPSHQKLRQGRWAVTAYLYSIPGDEGYCIPETHDVCTSDYYLAVHNYELPIRTAVFRLGRFGELTNFRWLEGERFGQGHLQFTARRYPKWAVEDNTDLRDGQQSRRYEMWVSPDSIQVEPLQQTR
jgi:hypothetical protein